MDDYISREETIKAFCEKCRGYYDGHCIHRGECDVDVIQNAPSAKVNTYCAPQWVSVKDKLPEPLTDVLVYQQTPRGNCDIGISWRKGNGEWMYKNICETLYWMPLPEPPKEN